MIPATRATHQPVTARRTAARSTVRFMATRPPAQLSLGIATETEPSLEQRINAAKATSANYEDLAAKASTKELRRTMLNRAAEWNAKALELIAQRNRIASHQP